MCSFLLTAFLAVDLERNGANFFLQRRGPDATTVSENFGFTWVHNLLHMTGERILQPFIEGDVGAMFNGEIYNYKSLGRALGLEFKSDGQAILPLYRAHGRDFPRHADGEFAVVVVDATHQEVVLATDVFGTKPLWVHWLFFSACYCI